MTNSGGLSVSQECGKTEMHTKRKERGDLKQLYLDNNTTLQKISTKKRIIN
jgi:hypothetical protein